MNRFPRGCPAIVVLLVVLIGQSASAQRVQRTAEILPTDAASWLNSAPITAAMLKGKAAVLWFYEET